jgi:ATP-dependent Clp protease ATP-binding subunit ClpC
VRRVDITRLMSGPARELLGAAATLAAERGGTDLDTEHLLAAAATLEPTRQLLARAGADPDALVRDRIALVAQHAGPLSQRAPPDPGGLAVRVPAPPPCWPAHPRRCPSSPG